MLPPNFMSPISLQPRVIVSLVCDGSLRRRTEDGHNHAGGNFPEEEMLELSFDG